MPFSEKNLSKAGVRERHAVISQVHEALLGRSIRHLCELLEVNRAWYYARPPEMDAADPDVELRDAIAAEQHHVQFIVIDTLAFKHHPGAHTGPWRDEYIIPRYNRAGVTKFAFLLATGTAPETKPAPEGPAQFPTGYFDSREQIERWFMS